MEHLEIGLYQLGWFLALSGCIECSNNEEHRHCGLGMDEFFCVQPHVQKNILPTDGIELFSSAVGQYLILLVMFLYIIFSNYVKQ